MSASRAPLLRPRLYALADLDTLGARHLPAVVGLLADAGVPWVQLRLKGASGNLAATLTERALRRVEGSDTALWIDDRVDVASCFDVLGVHVGQQDVPPVAARRVLGSASRIGRSTHTVAQCQEANADPDVDAIAVGPVFATQSKKDPEPVVGLDLVRQARAMTIKPLIAIGGIDESNAAAVLDAGADTVAVLGALCRGDVASNAKRMMSAVAA